MIELLIILGSVIFWDDIVKFLTPEKKKNNNAIEDDPEITEPCGHIVYKPLSPNMNQGDAFLPKGYCYRGDTNFWDDKPHTTGDVYATKQAEKVLKEQKLDSDISEMKNIVLILANETAAEIDTTVVDVNDNEVVFPDPYPDPPVATSADTLSDLGFTVRWDLSSVAKGYYLDISTDSSFATFVSGYENKDIGNNLFEAAVIGEGVFYYRVRAYNTSGTSRNSNTVTVDNVLKDIDGNEYTRITIGSLIVTVENFRATKYADNTDIANITDNAAWAADTVGAYCWYNNNSSSYKATYGALYNWFAVNNAAGLAYLQRNGIQETGWRVNITADDTGISTTLGGDAVAGGHLKKVDPLIWTAPNTGADNSSGFTGVPGGRREYNTGAFASITVVGYYWTGTETDATFAHRRVLTYNNAAYTDSNLQKNYGFSVRLVKDV